MSTRNNQVVVDKQPEATCNGLEATETHKLNHDPVDDNNSTCLDHSRHDEMARRSAKRTRKWNRRLRVLFCCLGYKKNKESITDVASILSEFYADLEVPSSDLAAGFVLLSKYQSAQQDWIVKNNQFNVKQFLSSVPVYQDQTKFLDITTAQDSHLINDLIYYMNYSLAIFGWPIQMVDDPCLLCCICPYLKFSPCCMGCRRRSRRTKPQSKPAKSKSDAEGGQVEAEDAQAEADDNNNQKPHANRDATGPGKLSQDCDVPIVLEDNCCGCNVASAEQRLASHNYEIIYVTYKVDVNVVPFLVAADHSKQTIVVAIRGSMSLSDMVTDMNGQTDKLPVDNCPDDWLSHRGMTRASSYVKSKLIRERILEAAFNCRPDLGSQNYTLILCGHSLGAGVAAILGILLYKDYPTLRAYLYSPPGGILSLPAVEYTKQFATGIVLGNDMVPRLGLAQLERLRYHILLSLKSSQDSSGKILFKALCPSLFFGKNEVEYDPTQSLDLLNGTWARSFEYNGYEIPFQAQAKLLYVPGRLIHVVKNHTFKTRSPRSRFFKEPIYQAIWSDNTAYDRIMIAEGMFYDHLPTNLMHAMKMLFSKTLPVRSKQDTKPRINLFHNSANSLDESIRNLDGRKARSGLLITRDDSQVRQKPIEKSLSENTVIKDDNNNNNSNQKEPKFDENNNNNGHDASLGQFIKKPEIDDNGNDTNVQDHNVDIGTASINRDDDN